MVSIFEKSKSKLKWDQVPEAAEAFRKTKELIAMRAKLFFYREDAPIFLLTDASDYGIGAYLYQIIDGIECPVAFVSKSLSGPQLRWPTIQKEAYAVYYSITHLEYLLRDRTFCLMTDHANLVYINKSVNAMVQRWKMALGSYDFVVKHIQGIRNIVADFLSRLVDNQMLLDIQKESDPEVKKEMILSLLHHDMKIPDDAYVKIKAVHNDISGHSGVEVTMNRLGRAYEPWLYMRTHVRHFVQTCPACQKMSYVKIVIKSKPYTVATYAPMVRLNIDFVGPINTDDETGYILVIIDTFSKWVELYACDTATAKEAAHCLFQHFGRYGAPAQILSDNGSHFVNEMIKEFLEQVGVEHRLTIAYSKEENAMVERANKEVNRHVRHICFDRRTKSDWRNTLPLAQRIINSHFSERTKISPAHILFGQAVDLDRGIFAPMPESSSQPTSSLSTHMVQMLKTQSLMIQLHEERLKRGDVEHAEQGPREYTVFEDGSYVLLDPATGKPKDRLHSRRLGPFLVVSHTDNTYELQNLVSKRVFKVNIHRIHPFYFDKDRINPLEVAAHDEEEFIVEAILGHEGSFSDKNSLRFKVRWLGFGPEYDTKEPWKNLRNVDKLHEYLRAQGQEKMIPKQFRPTRS
jgi:transposase InsO family protein